MTDKTGSFPHKLGRVLFAGIATLVAPAFATPAATQEASEPPRLAWIDFDFRFAGYSNSQFEGSGNDDLKSAGKFDAFVTFDGEQAGLWQGISASAQLEYVFGQNINNVGSGAIWPVNTPTALPRATGDDYVISATVSQAFGEAVNLSAGRFNLVEAADVTPLLGGRGKGGFLYVGIAAPPTFLSPPYVLGGLLSVKTRPANLSLFVYDPRNAQNGDVIKDPFSEGVVYNGTATVPTMIAGLPGFYGVNLIHSTGEGTDFDSLLLPPGSKGFGRKISGLTYAALKFQQYLVHDPVTNSGWGVFGQLGFGDGNPHQLDNSVMIGVGGTSPISGRKDDRWGVAYSRFNWSNRLIAALEANGLGLRDEWAVEAFYEAGITEHFRVGANIQSIRPGTPGAKQAYFAGVRARMLY